MTCNNDSDYWCLSDNDCVNDYRPVCEEGCCVEIATSIPTLIPTEFPTVSPIEVEDPPYFPTESPIQIEDPPTDDNIGSKSTKVSKSAKSKGPTSKSTKSAKRV